MIVHPILAFLSFLIVFFLGTLVFAMNTKHPVNRAFLVFSLVVGFMNLSQFGLAMAKDYNIAIFWSKVQMIFPVVYIAQYHLVLLYTAKLSKVSNKLIISGYILAIVLSIFCMFNLQAEIVEKGSTWIRLPKPHGSNFLLLFTNIYRIIFISLILFQGGRYILATKDRSKRIQIGLFIIAIAITPIYHMLKSSILPAFHIEILLPISVFNCIGWFFIAFSIWKYQLFDITPEFAARKIISTIHDGLVLINNKGIVLSANKVFIELSGLEESHVIGNPIDKFFTRCYFSEIDIPIQYKKKELKNQPFQYYANDKGKLILQFSNSFVVDKSDKILGHACVIADITSYAQIQHELKIQNQDMLTLAHRAGMAEIATGVMHNIGNLMNSLSISTEKIIETLKKSKLHGFTEANKLLASVMANPVEFLANNPQGKLLPQYYSKLAISLENEHNRLTEESAIALEKVIQIKDAIEIQQDYAKSGNFNEQIKVIAIIDEALRILESSILKHDIVIRKKILISENLEVLTSRTRLMNILLNLLKNAMESVSQNGSETRIIEIDVTDSEHILHISIADNGMGITKNDYRRLFNYGFTTKTGGHGFGLHFCANALKEMDGAIEAISAGKGEGAEFKISLPKIARIR